MQITVGFDIDRDGLDTQILALETTIKFLENSGTADVCLPDYTAFHLKQTLNNLIQIRDAADYAADDVLEVSAAPVLDKPVAVWARYHGQSMFIEGESLKEVKEEARQSFSRIYKQPLKVR